MPLPTNIVTDFTQITRFDLSTYLNDYVDFIDNSRLDIFDYYSGNVQKPNQNSFNELTRLIEEGRKINSLIDFHRNRMANAEYWELIDTLTQIQESLLTVDNASKWLRSVITKNNFSPDIEIESVLNQLQTLEQLARKLGSNDTENDWIKIALRNNLREEDYTSDGGNVLSVSYKNRLNINILSVVDNIDGEKIYGLDLNKKITFINDDIEALTHKETIKQTVGLLADLRAGNTPEFPLDGIQVNLVAGSNRNSIAYPVLFRQMYATFQKDDTLKSLAVKSIENTDDSLEIEFEVETRFGEVIPVKTAF